MKELTEVQIGNFFLIVNPQKMGELVLFPARRRFHPSRGLLGEILAIHQKTVDVWFSRCYPVPGDNQDGYEEVGVFVRMRKPSDLSVVKVLKKPAVDTLHRKYGDYAWHVAGFSSDPYLGWRRGRR